MPDPRVPLIVAGVVLFFLAGWVAWVLAKTPTLPATVPPLPAPDGDAAATGGARADADAAERENAASGDDDERDERDERGESGRASVPVAASGERVVAGLAVRAPAVEAALAAANAGGDVAVAIAVARGSDAEGAAASGAGMRGRLGSHPEIHDEVAPSSDADDAGPAVAVTAAAFEGDGAPGGCLTLDDARVFAVVARAPAEGDAARAAGRSAGMRAVLEAIARGARAGGAKEERGDAPATGRRGRALAASMAAARAEIAASAAGETVHAVVLSIAPNGGRAYVASAGGAVCVCVRAGVGTVVPSGAASRPALGAPAPEGAPADVHADAARPGDLYVLASPALVAAVDAYDIAAIAGASDHPSAVARALVDAAEARGVAPSTAAAVVVHVGAGAAPAAAAT